MFNELEPIRFPAKYIAELFRETEWDPRLSTPIDDTAGVANMFSFSVAPLIEDPSNYWIAWGGFFDNYVGLGVQIFLDTFLTQVENLNACINTINSYFVDETENIVHINIPRPPWQYSRLNASLSINEMSTFSTAPKNENNPSDIFYGVVQCLPRMRPPSVRNQLSDAISGIVVYNSFDIEIDNADGLFDAMDIIQYFNTPMQIRKSTENAQTLTAFNVIRFGLVTDIDVSAESLRITGVDQFYRMEGSVCRRISLDEFPNATDNIDEEIPIGWGALSGVELLFLYESGGTYYYIALDKNWITSVSAAYDSGGVSRAFSFNSGTGVISSTFELETADIVGRVDNRIGKIIIELLQEFENIDYVYGIWDIVETDKYLDICASINLYIDSGSTKDAIESTLKNDIAFLIQKNNKLLSIRQWGQEYNVWQINDWLLTQKPEKDFKTASKYYASSVQVNYSGGIYVDTTREAELFSEYRRKNTAVLDTFLNDEESAESLAQRFLERFGEVRETVQAGYGVDTFEINLLDTVITEISMNNRQFSQYSKFVVTEIDPGQDTIRMEGVGVYDILTFDGFDATLENFYLWGVQDE